MLDLALSILSSSLIFVIFKLFKVYKVQTLYAIIVNYITAFIVGVLSFQGSLTLVEIPARPWFLGATSLGVLFILVFNLIAKTSQELGVSVASVATKMSLVIPVVFGVLLYQETLGRIKILGILLALAAVYFASVREKSFVIKRATLILPLLVFLGSGVIDVSIKFFEAKLVSEIEFPIFTAFIFGAAAISGFIFILIRLPNTPLRWNMRNCIGGIVLGVPNFFSIFFLLRALQHETLNSASVFTINNVAIVMFSTLLGILLFKEKISLKNWAGIGMAVLSIVLVALGDDLFSF
ncbi:MAG: DMT family transporter [Eudoraea sp.]|nr:DMT family transporter [Eudoraea sp.]